MLNAGNLVYVVVSKEWSETVNAKRYLPSGKATTASESYCGFVVDASDPIGLWLEGDVRGKRTTPLRILIPWAYILTVVHSSLFESNNAGQLGFSSGSNAEESFVEKARKVFQGELSYAGKLRNRKIPK
jgi:hypothetical protein